MCCFLNTWNLQLYKVLDPTAPFILPNWKHRAHLNKRDDCKLNWLFLQCLKKPLIKFRVATLKVFLPYRGMVSVIKLAWSRDLEWKWMESKSRKMRIFGKCNQFLQCDTSFPITSNTGKKKKPNICENWVESHYMWALVSLPLHSQRWLFMELARHLIEVAAFSWKLYAKIRCD